MQRIQSTCFSRTYSTPPESTSPSPASFESALTQHTRRLPSTWFSRTYNSLVPSFTARSGDQFMIIDAHAHGRPLLVNLSE